MGVKVETRRGEMAGDDHASTTVPVAQTTSEEGTMDRAVTSTGDDPLTPHTSLHPPPRSQSPVRTPTSAEIDAVIAAAMANAPPAPGPPSDVGSDINRSSTPLMTNLLPAAVGADGRVNLFIGNLPYRVRWQDLKDLFRKAGTVLRADVSLGPDNRSRGYGTILMGSREDAARAIDRFNGYTWQTRTLEVRPDRLPPEYEAQPHLYSQSHHNAPPRPPTYNYHNLSNGPGQHLHPAYPVPGPQWPGQMRPLPGSFGMYGQGIPHAPPMGMAGSNNSASDMYGLPLLNGQHTGGQYSQYGASPLAGSLSAGPNGNGYDSFSNRDSLTPHGYTISPDATGQPRPRSSSPQPILSRPSSSLSRHSSTREPSLIAPPTAPAGPSGSLAHPPAPVLPGMKSVNSLVDSVIGMRGSFSGGEPPRIPALQPMGLAGAPISMEGLKHQGPGLGPPSTLHDRVVFVSNLPDDMQWQELKDLLRPAGEIMRADVAQDPDGRPRGFGTALFASEGDASKAVAMFNDREVSGRRISVHLERDSVPEPRSRSSISSQGYTSSPPNGTSSTNPSSIITNPSYTDPSHPSQQPANPTSTIGGRVPWSLNTSFHQSTPTPNRRPIPSDAQHTPHAYRSHHPGPISMPPFPSLDGTPNFSSHISFNPLSPQARNLPPMTPSMPGFVLGAGYPDTPPIHPQFLSPGIGPFSPGLPVSPGPGQGAGGFGWNPFVHPTPGGSGGVARFGYGGSAVLDTPTTQAFPGSGYGGYGVGDLGQGQRSMAQVLGDYFPNTNTHTAEREGEVGSVGGGEGSAPPSPTLKVGRTTLNGRDRMASSSSTSVVGVLEDAVGDLDIARIGVGEVGTSRGYGWVGHKKSLSGMDVARNAGGGNDGLGMGLGAEVGERVGGEGGVSRASVGGYGRTGGLGKGSVSMGPGDWAAVAGDRRASVGHISKGK